MRYDTFADVQEMALEEVAEVIRLTLEQQSNREREVGRTVLGPHRDDLSFRLDQMDVRRYASQGQHRTFGLALKVAQYVYLHDRRDVQPVLLLDDIFGNLDPHRTDILLRLLQSDAIGQSILTSTHADPFRPAVDFDLPEHRLIAVQRDPDGRSTVSAS